MSDLKLTKTKMQTGVWQGVVSGAVTEPKLSVTHLGAELHDVTVLETKEEGTWLVQIPIPAVAIADGVQTIVIEDKHTGIRLENITLIAGEPVGDDLRAEVDLLRAELDMLKRAFRRHCVETT
ncbi:MAG: hypothetical protein AB8B47_11555 [Roseobacter sp.]